MKRHARGFGAVCAIVLVTLAGLLPLPALAKEIVDLRGRTVEVPGQVDSLTIDDGRFLIALSLIDSAPVDLLAAWPRDIKRLGQASYARYRKAFPALETLPTVASSAENFDMESVLAVAPDVALMSLGRGPSDAQLAQLEAAGIPVVFIDFFNDPFAHQAPSLRILGQLTGHEARAEAYLDFRDRHLRRISQRVADIPAAKRPSVFVEAHAGITNDCCFSPGKGGMGDYIDFVGGHNIGADVLEKAAGKLNLEYIIASDPHVYIATGGPDLRKTGGLVLGGGVDARRARSSLASIAQRPGIAQLTAVKQGNVHGLAHQLLNSPLDTVAIEAFAKWVHPEMFEDVAPSRTLEMINRRFLAVPYEGVGWVDLK
ncbi:ABC transporter substrate-binding protein [Chromohalobacter canadensis]|uniref:ABC transporter substrate-binding protein n=1 Tax=Chromohalobacter canadensis TaxID=141389 RepID=UPI00240ECB36|nr:ABC transporter substrate-binding protein [Chromohalobacter canadensis]